jgi:tetratricopeptide (TPR) repeat protein
MKTVDELWQLLQEARQLPYGSAQIALVEQVLRHADAAGDRELSYATRMVATTSYVYGGEVAKSFVTFSWCLSDFDRDPAPFHARFAHSLLWYFKYMVVALTKFPEVPLDRTYAVLDDMERRYREGGHSLQAVLKHRYLVARHVGDQVAADEWYGRWITAPRDSLSDCAGCDPTAQVLYLADRGRDEDAIALAEPVLAGQLTCTEQPQNILSGLLLPYVRTGRSDAAADAHRRAYRLVRGNVADLRDIGDHIAFCARTGNEHRGLEILQRHIDWLDRAPSPAAGMAFAASSALLLRRLTQSGHGAVPVHRRQHGERPAEDVAASVLAEQLAAYATDLSLRFDARNGTTAQSRWVAARLTAEPLVAELPLSPTARRRVPAASPGQRTVAPQQQPVAPPLPLPADLPEVPPDATAATLLDLAEEHDRADRDEARALVLAAFDERFGAADLGPEIAARRADLLATERWDARDPDGAIAAVRAAVNLYRQAGADVRASNASGSLGVMLLMTGAPDGADLVTQDVAYQDRHGDLRHRATALARSATAHLVRNELDLFLEVQDRADALVTELGDDRLAARCAMRRAFVLAQLHRHEEAAVVAGEAREFYRRHGGAELFAAASVTYGRSVPDQQEAVVAFGEAVAVGHPNTVFDALLGRARALMTLGRAADAVADYVELVALCAERDLDEPGAFMRHELATAYQRAGRAVEAAEVAEEAIPALDRLGHDDAADNARFLLAGLYQELGDVEAALALYDELVGRLAKGGNDAGQGQMHENAGEVLFRADRDATAAERFASAAEAYRAADEALDELRVLRRRVSALHWADDTPAAEEAVRHALTRHAELPADIAGQSPAVWERAMLGFEAGRTMMSRGRYAEALPYLTGQPDRLRSIGAVDDADEVEGMLAEALLRSGRPTEAAALLHGTLAGMRPDAPTRSVAAQVLAEALDELGRDAEAAAVRAEHQLDPDH